MKRKLTTLAAITIAATMSSAAMAQSPGEIANFNTFLDSHPSLAQQLAANPGLADNPHFLARHRDLQNFLDNHPGVSASLHAAPGRFMYREGQYEWAQGGGPIAAAPGTASGPVARFDEYYLDQHREVAQQLARDPRLADNPQFLARHPGLEAFLAAHPDVRTELQAHPGRFMTDEWRNDIYGRGWRNQGGITRGEVARFDEGYLDQHPEVARQLGHDPRLADNPQFLATHPGLDAYLAAHPGVRTELQEHPDRFMSDEWKFERHEHGRRAGWLANTDTYLDAHPEVAAQLKANPKLVDNAQFVDSHPGLHEFLQTHPNARKRWKSHPYRFMQRENSFDQTH